MKTGLILEGGAMRGMFTAGVLDVLMEHGITVDGAIGVSAGAVFGCNYKSHQIGRTVRPYCRSGRPLGSELQPAPARKPSQPVKLLSLLRCACLLSPSLRLEYSGRGHFDNRESSYHILGRFASTAGRF